MASHVDPHARSLSRTGSPARLDKTRRSVSTVSASSRVDVLSNRLRVEEELWAEKTKSNQVHRDEVLRRAKQIENETKARARETLTRETERSGHCMDANRQSFLRHLQRSHELQSIRHQHVEDQSEARRRWEAELARSNAVRTEQASGRHNQQLSARQGRVQDNLTTRFTTVKQRQDHLERERTKMNAELYRREQERVDAATAAATRIRIAALRRQQSEDERIQLAIERAKAAETRRLLQLKQKDEEDELRMRQALVAKAAALAKRRSQKEAHDAMVLRQKAEAEANAEARRRMIEMHFEETITVGTEARAHNARVHRPPSSARWF